MCNIKEEMFYCEREGLKIKGMEFMDASLDLTKKHGVIISSHGFSGNYLGGVERCRKLAELGYVTYSFSFCGGTKTADDEALKSEGKTTDATIQTEIKDLKVVIAYVKTLPYIDEKKIILLGTSQGGFISALTAAECGEEIERLILVCPALCIPDHARRGKLGGASYDSNNVPEIIDCQKILLGKKFHDGVVDMDPFLEIAKYKGKVLLIHGMEDQTVDYSYAVRAQKSYEEGQCHLSLMRNAAHKLEPKETAAADTIIKQFLLDRKELFFARIVCTHTEVEVHEDHEDRRIYFMGYIESDLFKGSITPEGCDAQVYMDGVRTSIRAEYTFDGKDYEGERCYLHVVNTDVNGEWKPTVKTNSKALSWLNDTDFTAVLEPSKEGPIVRFWA